MTNLPISGEFYITAAFGETGSLWASSHRGIDFVSQNKTVYSTCEGTVRVVGYDSAGWGRYVSIGDSNQNRHIFCHLKEGSVRVSVGQKVTRETVIGVMGDTGNVTGVHLHFEMHDSENKVINPADYLGVPNKRGTYNSSDFSISEGNMKQYNDKDKISAWAKQAVERVTQLGIMQGDDLGNFNPKSYITREEMAVIITRLNKEK